MKSYVFAIKEKHGFCFTGVNFRPSTYDLAILTSYCFLLVLRFKFQIVTVFSCSKQFCRPELFSEISNKSPAKGR